MSCEIVFYAFFVCGHYCLQIGFIKVCIFYSIFCKSSFSCFCDFCVFCLFCVEFDENVVNFITLYNPCLYRCQVHCDFALTLSKQLVQENIASYKFDHR